MRGFALALLSTATRAVSGEQPSPFCAPLENHGGTVYTTVTGLGTPAQKLLAVPDTGSYSLVVASSFCKDGGCNGHRKVNVSKSSSAVKKNDKLYQITYGSGKIDIRQYSDNAAFYSSLEAATPLEPPSTASVGVMVAQTLEGFDTAAYDGIVGMGKAQETDLKDVAFLTHLGITEFTVCMGSPALTGSGVGGVLWMAERMAIEGADYVELEGVGQHAWATKLTTLTIGSGEGSSDINMCTSGEKGSCGAIIDSGTTLMLVPSQLDEALREKIEAGCSETSCLAGLEESETCSGALFDALPTITLNLGGQDVSLAPSQYMGVMDVYVPAKQREKLANGMMVNVTGYKEGIRCIPLFSTIDEATNYGPLVILGLPFFRSYATHFDRNTGSMAVAPLPAGTDACDHCPGQGSRRRSNGGGANGGARLAEDPTSLRETDGHALLPSEELGGASRAGPPMKMSELRWPTLAGVRFEANAPIAGQESVTSETLNTVTDVDLTVRHPLADAGAATLSQTKEEATEGTVRPEGMWII